MSFYPDLVSERMSDETGVGKPHSVVHRKLTRDIFNENNLQTGGAGPGGAPCVITETLANYGGWYNDLYTLTALGTWQVSHDSSVPNGWNIDTATINEHALKEQVFEKARQLKADVLLNLVEANQIVPSVKSLVQSIPNMRKHWGKLRQELRNASGSYLAWKFGVSPIVSDMESIYNFVPTISSSIQRHVSEQHSRFSIAQPLKILAASTSVPADFIYNGVNCRQYIRTNQVVKQPEVRYVLVVKPVARYGFDFFKKADYFMRRFATSPANLAWEKIPFSFVFDWLFDVRSVLRTVDKCVGFEPFEIVSFTRSHSYRLRSTISVTRRSPCNGSTLRAGSCHRRV
jgi:hypothetical protein